MPFKKRLKELDTIKTYVNELQEKISYIIDNVYIKSLEVTSDFPLFTPFNIQNDVLYLYNELIKDMLENRIKNKRLDISDLIKYKTLSSKKESLETGEQEELTRIETKFKDKPFRFFNIIKDRPDVNLRNLNKTYEELLDNMDKLKEHYYISPKVVSIDMAINYKFNNIPFIFVNKVLK